MIDRQEARLDREPDAQGVGAQLFQQVFVIDPPLNTFGGALSDAGTLQRCQTYRGVTYNSADSCSSNSQLLMPVHQARTACR